MRESLQLIETLIRLEIERLRAEGIPAGQDDYAGLYVSDQEAERLARPQGDASTAKDLAERARQVRQELFDSFSRLDGPIARVASLGKLNEFETGCLLLCLAGEIDLRYERLLGYVQNDITRRQPSVALALRLLSEPQEALERRASFSEGAPLRRLRLIAWSDPGEPPGSSLLGRSLVLDAHIAGYFLGQMHLDEALSPHAVLLAAEAPEPLPFSSQLKKQLALLAGQPLHSLDEPLLHLSGRDGSALLAAARSLAVHWGLRLFAVDLPPLVERVGMPAALLLALRQGVLLDSAVYLGALQELSPQDTERLRPALLHCQANIWPARLVLLGSTGRLAWAGLSLPVGNPEADTRRRLWQTYLGIGEQNGRKDPAVTITEADLEALAGKFRLNGDEIAAAVQTARGSARWRNPAQPQLELADLYAAARSQSSPILSNLAQKVPLRYRWDDIVLPSDSLAQIQEMRAHIEQRHQVYDHWGFGDKLSLGKGLMALFAGPSGTGKTMAAGILASYLGLDLYKIDLSGVVSKYIGETEKNLSRIFAEAENSNAILFFDEADALFGKRSEVKDAHDRYANIEIAYLLQKMEEYEGAVILATNIKMNLDEAFLRRMHFVVDFPEPDEADRRRIWERTMPAALPLGEDVDLDYLAHRFKLTGGNIRNIILAAAFLAAAEGTIVNMQHLLHATRREFLKIGKMISPADFDPQTYRRGRPVHKPTAS